MPATIEEPVKAPVSGRSFADLLPETQDAPERAPEPPVKAAEPVKTAEPAKATEPPAKGAEKPPEAKPEPGINPHLDEPVTKPAEKKPDATDNEIPAEYLKGMTTQAQEKARETWKTNKAERAAAEAERDAVKSELAAARKQLEEAGKTGPEIDAIKKERDELKARLAEMDGEIAISRVESTREFKQKAAAPMKESEEIASGMATKYEANADDLLKAVREPDESKRADLLEELTTDFKGYDRTKLFRAADDYAAAQKVAAELRANAGVKLEELTKAEKQEMERATTTKAADYRKAADAEWKAIQERTPILRPVDGKPEWNSYLDGIRQEVETVDVNAVTPAEIARARAHEKAMPEVVKALTFVQKQVGDLREKLRAAEERIAGYRGTEPGAGAGATTNGEGKAGSASFFDAVFEEK